VEGTVQNLELKVRLPDAAALVALAVTAREQGAEYRRTMFQHDTYFAVPHGRLKLREWRREDGASVSDMSGDDAEAGDQGAVLIAYDRPDETGSRISNYLLCQVPEPDALRTLLAQSIGSKLVVEKRRRLFQWGHTRIHLDRVTNLGPFVELETVVEHFLGIDTERQDAAEAEHRQVIALLGLDRLPAIAGSYSDLLAAPD
jgi:adenylate cyclase, class 2